MACSGVPILTQDTTCELLEGTADPLDVLAVSQHYTNPSTASVEVGARRNRNPVYMAPTGRGIRPVRPRGVAGAARAWILVAIAAVAMAALQHYASPNAYGSDLVLLGDVGILVAGYIVWLKTG